MRNNMQRVSAIIHLWMQAARLMVGVGDYPTYLAHMQLHHAGVTPLTKRQWFRQRQDARYGEGDGKIKRCPC